MSGPATVDEIRQEFSLVERLFNGASSTDEYLEALYRVNRLQYMAQSSGVGGALAGIEVSDLPANVAGIALENIANNDTGICLFDVRGYKVILTAKADGEINREEVVRVAKSGNRVQPESDVDADLLSFGDVSGGGLSFERTQTPEENVTIGPGEEEVVLEITTGRDARLAEVGTSDLTFSKYQYKRDGEDLLNEPLTEPLGLYNDPYRFQRLLPFENKFEVVVKRDDDAPGPEDYFSKATYYVQ